MDKVIAKKIITGTPISDKEILESEWVLGVFSDKEVWALVRDHKVLVCDCPRKEIAKDFIIAHNQKLSLSFKIRKMYKLIDGRELILPVNE